MNRNKVYLTTVNIIVGFFIFTLLSLILPPFVARVLNANIFYKIDSPVSVISIQETEDSLNCYTVTLYIERFSKVSGNADFGAELVEVVRLQDNEVIQTYELPNKSITIMSGDSAIIRSIQLPCNINAGEFALRGLVVYKVYGITKSSVWYSDNFTIE